jgi:surfactin synthase thioesterase subunit
MNDDLLWVPGLGRRPLATLRLFCLPYAGGGASTYNGWPAGLPDSIETCAFALPGRERRLREPPLTALPELVEALVAVIARNADEPFALFGHSMGALVAFELARALQRRGLRAPAALFVSAHRAPQQPRTELPLRLLPDAELIEALRRRYGAIPPEVAREPSFLRLLLPLWRADFTLIETYEYLEEPPLDCPLSVFAGSADPFTRDDDLELWRRQTTSTFRLRTLPGDHFFTNSARNELLRALSEDLASSAATQSADAPPGLRAR